MVDLKDADEVAAPSSENKNDADVENDAPAPIKSKHKPLTENESQLMAEIQNADVEKVVGLLAAGTNVNCLDAHGMTPLMQAAHKGLLFS